MVAAQGAPQRRGESVGRCPPGDFRRERSLRPRHGSRARLVHAARRAGRELEHKTITIYLFTTSEVDLRPRDAANPEAHWVPAESVADLLSNSIDRQFFVAVLPRVMEQACFHEY